MDTKPMQLKLLDRSTCVLEDGTTFTRLRHCEVLVFSSEVYSLLLRGAEIDELKPELRFRLDSPQSLRALANLIEQRGELL